MSLLGLPTEIIELVTSYLDPFSYLRLSHASVKLRTVCRNVHNLQKHLDSHLTSISEGLLLHHSHYDQYMRRSFMGLCVKECSKTRSSAKHMAVSKGEYAAVGDFIRAAVRYPSELSHHTSLYSGYWVYIDVKTLSDDRLLETVEFRLPKDSLEINCISFSEDSQYIMFTLHFGLLVVFSWTEKTICGVLQSSLAISDAQLSPDPMIITLRSALSDLGTVFVNLRSGKMAVVIPGDDFQSSSKLHVNSEGGFEFSCNYNPATATKEQRMIVEWLQRHSLFGIHFIQDSQDITTNAEFEGTSTTELIPLLHYPGSYVQVDYVADEEGTETIVHITKPKDHSTSSFPGCALNWNFGDILSEYQGKPTSFGCLPIKPLHEYLNAASRARNDIQTVRVKMLSMTPQTTPVARILRLRETEHTIPFSLLLSASSERLIVSFGKSLCFFTLKDIGETSTGRGYLEGVCKRIDLDQDINNLWLSDDGAYVTVWCEGDSTVRQFHLGANSADQLWG